MPNANHERVRRRLPAASLIHSALPIPPPGYSPQRLSRPVLQSGATAMPSKARIIWAD